MAKGSDKPKKLRPALITRAELIELIYFHAKWNHKDGTATGFENCMGALLKLENFIKAEKDSDYVLAYLERRIKDFMGLGIPMPVFTDIPREPKGPSQQDLDKALAEALLKEAGVNPELVAKNADVYTGADRRKKDRRASDTDSKANIEVIPTNK